MALILDASVLVRLANASDALHPTATRAVLARAAHDVGPRRLGPTYGSVPCLLTPRSP